MKCDRRNSDRSWRSWASSRSTPSCHPTWLDPSRWFSGLLLPDIGVRRTCVSCRRLSQSRNRRFSHRGSSRSVYLSSRAHRWTLSPGVFPKPAPGKNGHAFFVIHEGAGRRASRCGGIEQSTHLKCYPSSIEDRAGELRLGIGNRCRPAIIEAYWWLSARRVRWLDRAALGPCRVRKVKCRIYPELRSVDRFLACRTSAEERNCGHIAASLDEHPPEAPAFSGVHHKRVTAILFDLAQHSRHPFVIMICGAGS